MPHQVVKASVHGSVGDLARITGLVKDHELNILAIGGGEAVTGDGEVGVIAMIIEPDGEAKTNALVDALLELELDDDRRLADVEVLKNIHIALANKIGELNKAVTAIGNLNIRAIVSMGDFLGESHVGLGFAEVDVATAIERLTAAQIKIVPSEEEGQSA